MGLYDSAVWRGVTVNIKVSAVVAQNAHLHSGLGWLQGTNINPKRSIAFVKPTDVINLIQSGWQSIVAVDSQVGFDWQDARQVSVDYANSFGLPAIKSVIATVCWQKALGKTQRFGSYWYAPLPKHAGFKIDLNDAKKLFNDYVIGNKQSGKRFFDQWSIVWDEGASFNWIVDRINVPPVEPPREWSALLQFLCKKPYYITGTRSTLIFSLGCPWPFVPVIPKKRVYIVLNEVTIVRLPELTPLDCTELTISGDVDSWCWSFNATLPSATQLDLVTPVSALEPREVRISVNGEEFDFIVEQWGRSRSFGKSGITISGRSTSTYLSDPFAIITNATNTDDATAQQLANLAVQYTDWAIDWQLSDWLVLANAYNFRGTPMGQLLKVAESVGGVVQTAPKDKSIMLAKRYPILPWDWAAATPYALVPSDIIVGLGSSYSLKPIYNGVYVSGESLGVTARVKRTSTAGELIAPMVVDPLITHIDAARMRGEAVLSDVGAQELFRFDMPVEQTLGILPLLKLIEIDEDGSFYRGITRAIRINAQWQDGVVVRQTLEIEKHAEPV